MFLCNEISIALSKIQGRSILYFWARKQTVYFTRRTVFSYISYLTVKFFLTIFAKLRGNIFKGAAFQKFILRNRLLDSVSKLVSGAALLALRNLGDF